MSKHPLTVQSIKLDESVSGARPSMARVFLSNGKHMDVHYSFNADTAQVAQIVANAVVEANQTVRDESLNRGLVEILIKVRKAVERKGVNSVHLSREAGLSKTEYNNAQKLRYHALLAEDEAAGPGYWLITWQGGEFLRGERMQPKSVTIKNRKIIDRSEVHVDIVDVMGYQPVWNEKRDYTPRHVVPMEMTQAGLPL